MQTLPLSTGKIRRCAANFMQRPSLVHTLHDGLSDFFTLRLEGLTPIMV